MQNLLPTRRAWDREKENQSITPPRWKKFRLPTTNQEHLSHYGFIHVPNMRMRHLGVSFQVSFLILELYMTMRIIWLLLPVFWKEISKQWMVRIHVFDESRLMQVWGHYDIEYMYSSFGWCYDRFSGRDPY